MTIEWVPTLMSDVLDVLLLHTGFFMLFIAHQLQQCAVFMHWIPLDVIDLSSASSDDKSKNLVESQSEIAYQTGNIWNCIKTGNLDEVGSIVQVIFEFWTLYSEKYFHRTDRQKSSFREALK